MSEKEIRVLYVQPGKYPEEHTIPNTYEARQKLVGEDLTVCHPWRDNACIISNDAAQDLDLPPNRLYGYDGCIAGSFIVCGDSDDGLISLNRWPTMKSSTTTQSPFYPWYTASCR